MTEEFFGRAEIRENEKLVRRGRPPLATTKKPISLRLDADVLAHFRASGSGWQGRINETLRRSMARARLGRK
ncbi:MAG TPA: BrnA antitoxin family protein [Beijerinckiaceae bacterium]|nr:BrnA antitoxin family protein [Beijerinckiaceae bacterium]